MISSEKIDEVRDRADIVEVISEYVPLTKRGSNYIGSCPFHSEKTPSFSVNDVKEIFYCFGCHTGGNVITFLMKYETLSFPEAVRSLAERYNIEIKEDRTKGKGDGDDFDAMVELNKVALKYFREELKGASGSDARAYLKDRGFEDEILDSFRVGLSADSWDGLVKHLKAGGHDLELAVKAGLLGKKEEEGKAVRYFDRFRGRILFPITDASGRVVGFGGRAVDGSEPKYLNSPESILFKKASILYGFYQAKREIGKDASAIVVEGYFDLLALHKYGFKSVVATMGTALTPEHVRRLKPYAKTIYTLFDFDEAGIKAAIRGLGFFLEAGVEARIIVLPDGKDPDDFLKDAGAEGLREALKNAEPLMDFFLKRLAGKCDLSSARGKADYVDEAATMILRMKSPVERDHYAQFAAKTTGVDIRSIQAAIGIVKATRKEFKDVARPTKAPLQGTATNKRQASPLLERTILRVVLRHPNLYNEEVREVTSLFSDPVLKAVAGRLGDVIRDGVFDAGEIFNEIDDEAVRGFIAESLVDDGRGFIESPEKMLEDSIRKFKAMGSPKESTLKLLEELEASGHGDVVKETLSRMGGGSLKDAVKSDKTE